ncbi:acyltransferase family protein [Jeotgalibacillus proteolyticus]|uniref:Acyltransferase n=1 Tax=Jeotgalibacillus proteolyticus TaxID=2082395 RepID=A0A2S5G7X5_9BACL|nr:acyltransferase family protein [Jeotgalibacillus proteolyticus]PPA69055.1 acyltransferase [Jeotgalibacillus proteolyticus]
MADLRSPEKRFRPELEGVRAVAALLVAIYHIWLGSVSGGVDVFFIVSGYLITTSLLSRMEREGKINYPEYLLGLGRRLFPIAFTVILVTGVLSILLIPKTVWTQTVPQLFSSAFYFQNWQLANNAVDYLAQNNAASPFQHFWALSIQGQFYITWPLLILAAYLIAKKGLKLPVRKTLLTILAIVFTMSLSYSIYITNANQPWAYFDTFARVWEFSLGGMLALVIPYLSFKKPITFIIGWLGLAIICLTGILLPVSNVFPGYAALLPTSGVILVIIAAENGSRFGVQRLLGSKPFLYFGSISYGFYLWHWPLLIFYYAYFGRETISFAGGISILLITFLLSILSVKGIEAPYRKMNIKTSKGKTAGVLAALMLPALIVGSTWGIYVNQTQAVGESTIGDHPGAQAISDNIQPNPAAEVIPDLIAVKSHLPSFYKEKGCYSTGESAVVTKCSYGVTENPDYTIAVVGGSHSGHWVPALEAMAEEMKLKIDVYNKDACRFSNGDHPKQLTPSCTEWNESLMEPLIAGKPDLVFTTANNNIGDTVPSGYISKWKELEGIATVFAVRDNPRFEDDIPTCVEEKGPEACSVPREELLSSTIPWENTENIPDNVYFADMTEYFCDDQACHAVIGNVLVYRDRHHISTVYAETLANGLKVHIQEALKNKE